MNGTLRPGAYWKLQKLDRRAPSPERRSSLNWFYSLTVCSAQNDGRRAPQVRRSFNLSGLGPRRGIARWVDLFSETAVPALEVMTRPYATTGLSDAPTEGSYRNGTRRPPRIAPSHRRAPKLNDLPCTQLK